MTTKQGQQKIVQKIHENMKMYGQQLTYSRYCENYDR